MNNNCWNSIGVWGDRTCSKLDAEVHCRNCSLYSGGGRQLLERLEPEGYAAEWTALIASSRQRQQSAKSDRVSVTIFRLGNEWLALSANVFEQVTAPSPVHAMPHNHKPLLRGIVNVRGQLLPCVSIHSLLGMEDPEPVGAAQFYPSPQMSPSAFSSVPSSVVSKKQSVLQSGQQGGYPRLVVIQQNAEKWCFEVDELYGLHYCQLDQLRRSPALNNQALSSFSKAMFSWHEQSVSYLDVDRLFIALRQRAL